MIRKVLIANRGEIALRIIRACRDLGYETVAVYSEADIGAAHVVAADEAVCVGPKGATDSYLNIPNIISAAMITGADAIHPGYGFLSENADFSEICEECSIVFVGPRAGTIRKMGDKARARDFMRSHNVPVVPGSAGVIENPEAGLVTAKEIGFPVLLKASAGGGGRGMRVVKSEDEFVSNYNQAHLEAMTAFGDGAVYVERYVGRPRHVEVQVFGDGAGGVVHLGERDCSVQRRHQKLIEEAPAPNLPQDVRERLHQAAVMGCQAAEYRGAGTVEFILDTATDEFYFMEMNTRLQVEHCVTEMVTRKDLVNSQLRLAAGDRGVLTECPPLEGHAIEFRINAEDPQDGFRPSPGKIERLEYPLGPWVRVDAMARQGDVISPFYDSMIAKVCIWGEDRPSCLRRAARALAEMRIEGIKTTLGFHREVLDNERFQSGEYDTRFVAEEYGLE